MTSPARRMMNLFEGYPDAHGTHGATASNANKGGKLEIKKTARTIRAPVTEEVWEQHLSGERPLGIIPVRSDGTCLWACIDVDRYDIDLAGVAKMLEDQQLPLTVCRTKSGGAHVYLFLDSPHPAEEVRAEVRKLAAQLGWGDCEIFPKQNRVLEEQGDLGNWLNMPYLGGDETERYAVKKTMAAYGLDEFLDRAESMRVPLSVLSKRKKSKDTKPVDETLGDGPPCLEILTSQGFPEGTRNNGMFALGIFCKKKFGSKWKEMLEKYNHMFVTPPLSSEEVIMIQKNIEKKDYRYSCKEQPLCGHCNASLCRTRKFGIGVSGAYPQISGLTKLDTDPPLWFLDIEEQRISLETRQLQNYRDFQLVCMEQLTVFFMPMKNDEWASIVGDAMESAIILEAAPEMSVRGHFMELLEDFCMSRHRGENREDLFLGKPWQDPDTGRHYFKLTALMQHLEKEGFKSWGRNTVGKVITEEIGGRQFFNIKGKGVNVVWVPDDFTTTPQIPLPASKRDPI